MESATSVNPLVDTIVEMNVLSIARIDASLEVLLLVRLAALVVVDARSACYLVTAAPVPTPCWISRMCAAS